MVTPELAQGYPPRDLLLNRARVNEQQQVMDQLSQELAELNAELGVLSALWKDCRWPAPCLLTPQP